MSSHEQVKKLKGHTEHILDLFIGLREQYRFLEPMLFNKRVAKRFSGGAKNRGFNVIKYSLFFSCVQDVANLALDADKRTPSLTKVLNVLADLKVKEILKKEYSVWNIPIPDDQPIVVRAALERMEKRETEKRAKDFDRIFKRLYRRWDKLTTSNSLSAFSVVRDKYTAHKEIHLDGDKYKLFDIGTLELKWKDLNSIINSLRLIVLDVNLLVRNASFNFEAFEDGLSSSVKSFWARKSA